MGVGVRAGIPGVAGGLGVPEKPIYFWKRFFFFARKREKNLLGVFFAFCGVFLCFFGVFLRFLGVFLCFWGVCVCVFFSRASAFFFGG